MHTNSNPFGVRVNQNKSKCTQTHAPVGVRKLLSKRGVSARLKIYEIDKHYILASAQVKFGRLPRPLWGPKLD